MDVSKQLEVLSTIPKEHHFTCRIKQKLHAQSIEILQMNVGKKCNLSCKHCHVEAGPHRKEMMGREVFEKCLQTVQDNSIATIDITGGAPEMNPHLEWFLSEVASAGSRVIVRSNLVILNDPAFSHFVDIYAENGIEIVASLPDYHSERVDRQRGPNVYAQVIKMMQKLNAKGYGKDKSSLQLHLVHNPVGTYIPGSQQSLEFEYKKRLAEHGIVFNNLFSITNCPVGRFLDYLIRSENFNDYMKTLVDTYNPSALQSVMCRTTLSVGWDGVLFDCDFNQMLDMPVNHGAPTHIFDFDMDELQKREIVLHNHCYCCTAGAGSSCQGTLDH